MYSLISDFDSLAVEKNISNKKRILRLLIAIMGAVISALAFNLFYVPNDLVSSGLSSLGIIFSHFFEIEPVYFIFFGNLILIILGLFTIGGKRLYKSIIGAIVYTSMVYLTKDIANLIHFSFDNIFLYVLAAGLVGGFGDALLFKMGYSAGGSNILSIILSHYLKKPIGSVVRFLGYIIVLLGGFTFGYSKVMYAIIIIFLSTFVIDRVMIGISSSKMFLIITNKEEIKKYITNVVGCGITQFESKGEYSKDKKNIFMCVVPTDKYYALKLAILEIDSEAFIVVNDCYETYGGTKRKKIPFISSN